MRRRRWLPSSTGVPPVKLRGIGILPMFHGLEAHATIRRLLTGREAALSAFVLVVRLGLGFMFIMSSVPKVRQPYVFLGSVYGYEMVGPKMGVLVAMVLPWVELLAGVCLVGGVFVGGALLASMGMGMLFTFVLGSALWRHLDISCGCFSSSAAGKVSYMTLIRAVVITLLSAAAYAGVILLQPKRWQHNLSSLSQSQKPISKPRRSRTRPTCCCHRNDAPDASAGGPCHKNTAGRMPATHKGGTPSPRKKESPAGFPTGLGMQETVKPEQRSCLTFHSGPMKVSNV